MSKKKSVNSSATDWEGTPSKGKGRTGQYGKTDWETVSSGGFPPMWKPEEKGENIIIRPLQMRVIPGKGKRKENSAVDALFLGGTSQNFFLRDEQVPVNNGDVITIPLSYNLEGEDKLAYRDKKKAFLSNLSLLVLRQQSALNIIFGGKVKGGQGTVKQFTIMAPRGFRETAASQKEVSKK